MRKRHEEADKGEDDGQVMMARKVLPKTCNWEAVKANVQ
jgi:hypothetical protein